MRVGFLGLGVMGAPMALNLSRTFPLTVWNRSPSKYALLIQAGAKVGKTPSDVAKQSDIIFTMLFNDQAIQSILDADFKRSLHRKILVNTSSVPVDFSQHLARQIEHAGGHFIEMPVSGSKIPAEQGSLVGMLAGKRAIAERIRPCLDPITSAAIYCGPIGSGLKTKYAVNVFNITLTAGLAEAMSLAYSQGLDTEAFAKVIDAGSMSSAYTKIKLGKMLNEGWSGQAAIKNCYNSTQLILSAAKAANAHVPLIELCSSLYRQANQSGLGDEDMIALFKTLQSRAS